LTAESAMDNEIVVASGQPTNGESHSLEQIEKQHILEVLTRTRWVIEGAKGAAKILDLHPNTLRSRMKKLGLHRNSIKGTSSAQPAQS
jgi:transcriptional regulator with GAF, ATPase, and Fis domain